MREFQRWKGLLSKRSIQQIMMQEREQLVSELIAELKKIGEDFHRKKGGSIPASEKPP